MNAIRSSTCPDDLLLGQYLAGLLDGADFQKVDRHLEECMHCMDVVELLDDQQSAMLANILQHPPSSPCENADPMLPALVRQAKAAFQSSEIANTTLVTGNTGTVSDDVLFEGAQLGPYVLLRHIGSGGMGRVFLAEHRRMKRRVALKMLAADWIRSPSARSRFQREIEAVSRLNSPHIVAAHDAGTDEGRDYLVMEYVEGRDLAEIVAQEGVCAVDQALQVILQVARGLEHAHAAGIVHRDVKPHNLLVDAQGTVKILDLGLARVLYAADENPCRGLTANHIMGTAAYMAPEQASDTHHVDARADIYSLGCTLFFLLTGKAPYHDDSAFELMVQHRQAAIPSVRQANPSCPTVVDNLVQTLLAKDPKDRPPSMVAVAEQIEKLLASPLTAGSTQRPSWLHRRSMAALAICLIATCVAVFFINAFVNDQAGVNPEIVTPGKATVAHATKVEPATTQLVRTGQNNVITQPQSVPPGQPDDHKARPETVAIDMVLIKAGTFVMGSSAQDRWAMGDEQPAHSVSITQPFYMGKYLVTQEEFQKVMGVNPSAFSPKGRFASAVKGQDTARHPVESISWLDAVRFCNRLSEQAGLKPYYKIDGGNISVSGGDGYRLPTEAEWEYACRAGSSTAWFFGATPEKLGDYAWFASNSGNRTHPVGLKKANPFGLFDILGNVSQWCWDRYDAEYYKKSPASDPPGAGGGGLRIHRGGSWNMTPATVRPAFRQPRGLTYAVLDIVGLRVARSVAHPTPLETGLE